MKRNAVLIALLCAGNAMAGPEGTWEAEIHCPPSTHNGLHSMSYVAPYQVAIRGNKVMLKREREVVEVLAGDIADGRLQLKGAGYFRNNADNRHWDIEANGAFPDGASSYEARVQLTRDGRGFRECKLQMRQKQP